MTIPKEIYQRWFGAALTQENSLPDGNGNELYHGIAPNNAAAGDGSWVIVKGIYSQVTEGGVTVWWGTHYSMLQGVDINGTVVSWTNAVAGSLVFP
jgi:hypothetical protein